MQSGRSGSDSPSRALRSRGSASDGSPSRSLRSRGSPLKTPGGASTASRLLRRVIDPAFTSNSNASKILATPNTSANISEQSSIEMARAQVFARQQMDETPRGVLTRMHAAKLVQKVDSDQVFARVSSRSSVKTRTPPNRQKENLTDQSDLLNTPNDGSLFKSPPKVKVLTRRVKKVAQERVLDKPASSDAEMSEVISDVPQTPDEFSHRLTRRMRKTTRNVEERLASKENSLADDVSTPRMKDVSQQGNSVLKRRLTRKERDQKRRRLTASPAKSSASEASFKTPSFAADRTKQAGLINAQDARDFRKKAREFIQQAEDSFANVRPQRTDSSEATLTKRRSAKTINMADYPQETSEPLDSGDPILANVTREDDNFRPNAESTRYNVSNVSSSTSLPAQAQGVYVPPSVDSEVQFGKVSNAAKKSRSPNLTAVAEDLPSNLSNDQSLGNQIKSLAESAKQLHADQEESPKTPPNQEIGSAEDSVPQEEPSMGEGEISHDDQVEDSAPTPINEEANDENVAEESDNDEEEGDEDETIQRKLMELGIVSPRKLRKVSGSKLAGKSPVRPRMPRKRRAKKQQLISNKELMYHFRRFYGPNVNSNCNSVIIESYHKFMKNFAGAIANFPFKIKASKFPAIVKLLLEYTRLLPESNSTLPIFRKIREVLPAEDAMALLPPYDLTQKHPPNNWLL